jgi:hypothetical protein
VSDINKTFFEAFSKNIQIKNLILKIRFVRSDLFQVGGQTDGQVGGLTDGQTCSS